MEQKAEKKRIGRRRLPEDQRFDVTVSCSVTKAMRDQIYDACDAFGLQASGWIRDQIFRGLRELNAERFVLAERGHGAPPAEIPKEPEEPKPKKGRR